MDESEWKNIAYEHAFMYFDVEYPATNPSP